MDSVQTHTIRFKYMGQSNLLQHHQSALPQQSEFSSDAKLTGIQVTQLFRNGVGESTIEYLEQDFQFILCYNGKVLRTDSTPVVDPKNAAVVVMIRSRDNAVNYQGGSSTRRVPHKVTYNGFSGPNVLATVELHGDAPDECITLCPRDRLGISTGVTLTLPAGAKTKNGEPFEVKVVSGPERVSVNGRTYQNVTSMR